MDANTPFITNLVTNYLTQNNCKESVYSLAKESAIYFNLRHFEQLLIAGNWDELEAYLSCFTGFNNNSFSTEIYFSIKKQKYFEALDKRDRAAAAEMLWRELKGFEDYNSLQFQHLALLLPSEDFRKTGGLWNWKDAISSRIALASELRNCIVSNPDLQGKLEIPVLQEDLESLLDNSLEYQHYTSCENPQVAPELHPRTLLEDKTCSSSGSEEQPRIAAAAPPMTTPSSQARPTSRTEARRFYVPSSSEAPSRSTSARRGRRG